MESRAERAGELFMEGCNCSQAVFVTYADLYGFDQATAMRIAASFGAGMGRMREVCGAVSGMFLVAGMETGATEGRDQEGKRRNYEAVQHLAACFKEEYGSIICRELLGLDKKQLTKEEREQMLGAAPQARTAEYYKKRPCKEQIVRAAKILEETILKNRFSDGEAKDLKGREVQGGYLAGQEGE
ncbi:MAG: C-GCAxxG-C-C family protein [Lachnospiraceae bacterium]|nr:C-GCAxxG-C-C family protein [Lachnospiraceae bacterium]